MASRSAPSQSAAKIAFAVPLRANSWQEIDTEPFGVKILSVEAKVDPIDNPSWNYGFNVPVQLMPMTP